MNSHLLIEQYQNLLSYQIVEKIVCQRSVLLLTRYFYSIMMLYSGGDLRVVTVCLRNIITGLN